MSVAVDAVLLRRAGSSTGQGQPRNLLCDKSAQNRFVAAPIDLGPEGEQVILILFGTGFRLRSSLSATWLSIGGVNVEVLYAGAQGDFVGLDQVNARLPRSLIGRGEVNVAATMDGKSANPMMIRVQ
jgi:uncharacterized protein (TIGR03437 family)